MEAPQSPVDVLVVGGGITGCGIARQASLRGLSVLVVEREDLASGTSSRSTKLLHGGLRYLEHGDLRLVREALREREITARLAPHLARPLAFVLPTRRGAFPGRGAARLGVALYDVLAGRQPLDRGSGLARDGLQRLLPSLADLGWTGGVEFHDRQTEDARLTVAIARDAARLGAIFRTRCEAVEMLDRRGVIRGARLVDVESGGCFEVEAGVVINAAGPWADRVRAAAGATEPALRTTRGAHLVLPDLGLRRAVLLAGQRPGHRIFAIPWRGATLFGTTDDEDRGDPGRLAPRCEDVDLLLTEATRYFPAAGISRDRVISCFAGIRPLVRAEGDTLTLSREHRILDDHGMLSLVGGKLTTWRSMAEDIVRRAARRLGRGSAGPVHENGRTLPGGGAAPSLDDPRLRGLGEETRRHLVAVYGSEAVHVAALAAARAGADALLGRGGPEIVAQVDFAMEREIARHADDVIFRRLILGHDPGRVRETAPAIVAAMSERLSWNAARAASEARRIEAALAETAPLPFPPPHLPAER